MVWGYSNRHDRRTMLPPVVVMCCAVLRKLAGRIGHRSCWGPASGVRASGIYFIAGSPARPPWTRRCCPERCWPPRGRRCDPAPDQCAVHGLLRSVRRRFRGEPTISPARRDLRGRPHRGGCLGAVTPATRSTSFPHVWWMLTIAACSTCWPPPLGTAEEGTRGAPITLDRRPALNRSERRMTAVDLLRTSPG